MLLLVAHVLTVGCETGVPTAVSPAPSAPVRLVLSTRVSQALAHEYAQLLPDLQFELVGARGSVAVVEALQEGRADVGFAFADVAYFGYLGRLIDTADADWHRPAAQLQGIAALNVSIVHLLARPGLPIDSVHDLRGLTVAAGEARSGQALLSHLIFDAYGLGPESLHSQTLAVDATLDGLTDRVVDAAFRTSYYPDELVSEALKAGAQLVPIDGPAADRLSQAYPFVRRLSVPANTYPDQRKRLRTIGLQRLLICRSDVDEEIVYELTKALFDALPRLAMSNQTSLRLMDLDRAPATPMPLHPGAARYYRELELLQ